METMLEIISSVFSAVWGLFTGVLVPGLGVSFAAWFLAIALAGFAVQLVSYVFGFGSSGTGYRSGQNGKKRISNDRKDDTH